MKEEQTIQAQLLQLYVKFIIFIVAARLSILQLNWWTTIQEQQPCNPNHMKLYTQPLDVTAHDS